MSSAAQGNGLDGAALLARIEALVPGLVFDELGSEGSQPIVAVRLPGPLDGALGPDSFRGLLDPTRTSAACAVERFVTADDVLPAFVERMHLDVFPAELGPRAQELADLLHAHVRELSAIVVVGDSKQTAQHPVYVVGVAGDRSVVGFRSAVIWT